MWQILGRYRGPNNENALSNWYRDVAVIQGAPTNTAALSVIQGAQTQPDIGKEVDSIAGGGGEGLQ